MYYIVISIALHVILSCVLYFTGYNTNLQTKSKPEISKISATIVHQSSASNLKSKNIDKDHITKKVKKFIKRRSIKSDIQQTNKENFFNTSQHILPKISTSIEKEKPITMPVKERKKTIKKSIPTSKRKNKTSKTTEKSIKKSIVKKEKTIQNHVESTVSKLSSIIASAVENIPKELDLPLSIDERDLIVHQIQQAWNISGFSGNNNNQNIFVTFIVSLNRDATIIDVKPKLNPEHEHLIGYQMLLDSAIRAIYTASPLQFLPDDKFEVWKELELTFSTTGLID